MIYIEALFPNPVGKDTEGEFLRLRNNSDTNQEINGWTLQDASGKIYALNGFIEKNGSLELPYAQTKISLNNDKETITLLNERAEIVDTFLYQNPKEGEMLTKNAEGIIRKNIAEKSAIKEVAQEEKEIMAQKQANVEYVVEKNIVSHKENVTEIVANAFVVAAILAALFGWWWRGWYKKRSEE